MTIVGIDNCATGGVVAISSWTGKIISAHPMPGMVVVRKGLPHSRCIPARLDKRFNEVDSYRLLKLLTEIDSPRKIIVFFEDCPDHANQSSTMRSMAISAGRILSVLEIAGIKYERVLPRTWQPVMLGKVKKGETKAAALARANDIWPGHDWRKTPRCTTAHDGMVDAALIAEYGRITKK